MIVGGNKVVLKPGNGRGRMELINVILGFQYIKNKIEYNLYFIIFTKIYIYNIYIIYIYIEILIMSKVVLI